MKIDIFSQNAIGQTDVRLPRDLRIGVQEPGKGIGLFGEAGYRGNGFVNQRYPAWYIQIGAKRLERASKLNKERRNIIRGQSQLFKKSLIIDDSKFQSPLYRFRPAEFEAGFNRSRCCTDGS